MTRKHDPEKEDTWVQKGGQSQKVVDRGDGGHWYEMKTMTLVIVVILDMHVYATELTEGMILIFAALSGLVEF